MIALNRAITYQIEYTRTVITIDSISGSCNITTQEHRSCQVTQSYPTLELFTPWNLLILFENFSAQSSLSTSSVGYPSSSSSQELSLSTASHWWSWVISASQFQQLCFFGATGVKTSDTGEGISFKHGEKIAGEFSLKGKLLSSSFSGDSTSFSAIWMSFLILCDKGGKFGGEWSFGELGRGRFFALWMLSCKAGTACRRWTQT